MADPTGSEHKIDAMKKGDHVEDLTDEMKRKLDLVAETNEAGSSAADSYSAGPSHKVARRDSGEDVSSEGSSSWVALSQLGNHGDCENGKSSAGSSSATLSQLGNQSDRGNNNSPPGGWFSSASTQLGDESDSETASTQAFRSDRCRFSEFDGDAKTKLDFKVNLKCLHVIAKEGKKTEGKMVDKRAEMTKDELKETIMNFKEQMMRDKEKIEMNIKGKGPADASMDELKTEGKGADSVDQGKTKDKGKGPADADKDEKTEESERPPASLVTIPGEIRNQIYGYLDFFDGVVCLHCPVTQGVTKEERLCKPALSRVCVLLRDEVLSWYVRSNRFEMTCSWGNGETDCTTTHGGDGRLQIGWLNSIEPVWDELRDVKFRLCGWNTWTRFTLEQVPGRDDDYFLKVTSGLPLTEPRGALLQLMVNSYFNEAVGMGFWDGRLLAIFLRDLPDVMWRVEQIARPVIPPRFRNNCTYNLHEGGFQQLICPRRFQIHPIETVDWVDLMDDPASVVSDSPGPGVLLLSKDAVSEQANQH